ncbi:hypothetical protein Tco_0221578 [Tanacetum coccineum]
MNPIATQQVALDNSLVAPEKRLKIERCNARIAFNKPQREETYQVTLEALKLSSCYPAFVITAKVPEIYMHQFWTTIKKIKNSNAYNFKLEKKKFRVDTEVFREILQICPRILNKDFIAPPSEEDLVTFIQELGYSGRCISGKTTRLDRLRNHELKSCGGMYNKKNVDYVALLWEDFMYQADNREISLARKEHMPYPRFTKVIINHFISKDKTIFMRNGINLHIIRDDSLLGTLKFVSKTQDYQQYGALIPDDMINQDIKDFDAYKTYYDFATRKFPPKKARKYKNVASPLRKLSHVKEAEPVKKAKRVKRPAKKSTTAPTTSIVIRDTPGVSVSKKKAPAKADRSDGTDLESGVPDEQQHKTSGADEGTDDNDDDSEDDNDDDVSKGDDDKADNDDDGNSDADDNERTNSDDDDENPSFTLKDYDEEGHDEEYESDDDYENMFEEEDDDLYKDVNVRSLGAEHEKEIEGDEEMTDVDQNVSQEKSYEQVVEYAHVTLTSSQKIESSKQSSSVSSDFASKFLILENVPPAVDEVASIMNVESRQEESSTQAPYLFTVLVMAIPETATAHATTVPPTISMITPLPQLTTPTTVPTTTLILALPNFASLFGFDQRVSTLETELSQLKQADLSTQVLKSIKSQLPTMVDELLNTKIGYATRIALHSYTRDFEKKAQEEMKLYIDVVKKLVKDIIKDEVKSLLPQILPKGKYQTLPLL